MRADVNFCLKRLKLLPTFSDLVSLYFRKNSYLWCFMASFYLQVQSWISSGEKMLQTTPMNLTNRQSADRCKLEFDRCKIATEKTRSSVQQVRSMSSSFYIILSQ